MALVPRIVAGNWRLKIAAFGLAVFLWVAVRAEPATQGDVFTIPVRAQVADLSWTLADEPRPSTVQVRFRGSPDDLIRLARQGATIRVPLDSVLNPDTVVQLRRDWVVLESGSALIVEDITPSAVRLTLQPTLSMLVPLRVRTAGELPSGLAVAAPVGLNPQVVRVRGPAPRVRAIDSVSLTPFDLTEVTGSGIYSVGVDTTGFGDVIISPLSTTLGLRVEPSIERVLAGVPVIAATAEGEAAPDSLVVEPSTIQVRLEGARTPVSGTAMEEVQAVIPAEALTGLGPGEQRRVPIRLRGVPALVRGFSAVDSVTVRRRGADGAGGGGGEER